MNYQKMIVDLETKKISGCKGSLIPGTIAKGHGQTFIVFGLNPSEADDDTEEFYNKGFYTINPEDLDTTGQRRWTKKLTSILPLGSTIVQAELIYWTSKDRRSLENRIGGLDFGNPYFDLSCEINYDLLSKYKDAKCLFLGFSHYDLVKKIFAMSDLDLTFNGRNGKRLLSKGAESDRFYMVRHPSSIGFSNDDKITIRNLLE